MVICSLLLTGSVFGQQIKSRPVAFDDFRILLEAAGYEAFSFDLTELLDKQDRYEITVYIKEYESGKKIHSRSFPCGPNKLLMTDFPEESRGEIAPEEMADSLAGIYRQAEMLTIGFYPSGVDSTKMVNINIPEMRQANQRLNLQSAGVLSDGRKFYKYHTRPFKIDSFEVGKFIPLVFYGSLWFDVKHNLYRFCGENEIEPDLSSEIVGNVPHFYVMGVKFTLKEPTNLKNN